MTTIRTEQARVALAHREFEQGDAETQRKIEKRFRSLKRDPRATNREAFKRLCAEDQELVLLFVELKANEVWRDSVIADGDVATIEDDLSVRWTAREYAERH
jgi:hypothetical protein